MSLRSDISGDWKYIEGVEDVTITPQNPAASAISSVKALLDLRGGNPLSQGTVSIDPSTATWHVWNSALNGYEPKNGDLLTQADNTVWTIQSVGESAMAGRFICDAIQQA